MKNIEQSVSAGTRLGSMILDHMFVCMATMVFTIPSMVVGMGKMFEVSHEPQSLNLFAGTKYLMIAIIAVYFCKDIFNGRSIAKRITKLQVVDNLSGKPASPLQCVVRNIFCLIWPVEVIVTLINPNRRIGDRVAGTKVVAFDNTVAQPKANFGKIAIAVIIGLVLSSLIGLPFILIGSKFEERHQQYIESSYNEASSNELVQLYAASLGDALTADVRVYDSIKASEAKYVSVILMLKEDYFQDKEIMEDIKTQSISLLHSVYPKNSVEGLVKFVYKAPGNMRSQSIYLEPTKDEKHTRPPHSVR